VELNETSAKQGLFKTLLVCGVIALVAVLLIVFIYSSEPKAQRETAVRETAMLVEVTPVARGTYAPIVAGLGTVTPAREILLSPRVPGRVIQTSSKFIPGGFVDEGETLLILDPSDYKNIVSQRKSALQQAESALAQERGRRDVAERDFEVFGSSQKDQNPALALREPQLAAAEAGVAAAKAALEQAELDLARTAIKAPFEAHILTRLANTGSEVSPGNALARIIGVDEYHVIVSVPLAALKHLSFPEDDVRGAEVTLRDRAAWGAGQTRTGHVQGLIGAIDGQTRLARVLVRVEDPLGLHQFKGAPKLIVGSILHAEIAGRALEDVVRINRGHLRQDDTVWIMQDGKLDVRRVAVAFKDSDYAYVETGLEEGELLVTSNLATVASGAPLRTEAVSGSSVTN